MANTFTPIIPNLTTGFQRVGNEKASLPAICQADFRAEEAAVGQTITIPIAPVVAGIDRTPAAIFTVAADRAVTNTNITITKDRTFPFYLTGDDFTRMVQNPEFVPKSIEQAMRAARNEIHSDLASLHVNAAGYYRSGYSSSGAATGTAGTAPFAGTYPTEFAVLEKYLNDSLAPMADRFVVIDTTAKQQLSSMGFLLKANEAGSDVLLRQGIVGQLNGFNILWDNDVKLWSPIGTGASYVANGVNAAGSTNLVVKTGTGTILAGDVITVTSSTVATKYVVGTGIASAGTLVLTSGLVQATADGDTVTVNAISRRNIAFHREALGLAVRLPKLPKEGDMGEHQVVTDPVTGLPMRFSTYKGYGLNNYELSVAWGTKAVRPELLKLLLG